MLFLQAQATQAQRSQRQLMRLAECPDAAFGIRCLLRYKGAFSNNRSRMKYQNTRSSELNEGK